MTDTFPIAPVHLRLLWWIVPIVLLLLGTVVVVSISLAGAYTARFEVSPAGLRVLGGLHGRLLPFSALQLDSARVLDLHATPSLAPARRTWGVAIPGYRSGWFRLRDGERALLYVTDPSRIAYIPTRRGYALLLSVADPAALLSALRRTAGAESPSP